MYDLIMFHVERNILLPPLLVLCFLSKLISIKPLIQIYHLFEASGYASVSAMRKIEKLKIKCLNLELNSFFLEECLKQGLVPKFANIRTVHCHNSAMSIIENELKHTNSKAKQCACECQQLLRYVFNNANIISWLRYTKSLSHMLQQHSKSKKENIQHKLLCLAVHQKPSFSDSLVNQSCITLTTAN